MNDMPPDDDASDEVDDLYRRAAALDPGGPSEATRRSILDHAARLAVQRAAPLAPTDIGTARRSTKRTWRPTVFATLAAAVLAGLVVLPRVWTPPVPNANESLQSSVPAYLAPPARAPTAPPVAVSAPPRSQAAPPMRVAQDSATNDVSARLSGVTATGAAKAASPTPSPMNPVPPRAAVPAQLDLAAQLARSEAAHPMNRDSLAIQTRQRVDSSAALRSAAQAGDIVALNRVLGQSVDVNGRDATGRTALMLAILQGQAAAVDALLAHGADPNAADATGTTPLQAAMNRTDSSIVAALRRAGANE